MLRCTSSGLANAVTVVVGSWIIAVVAIADGLRAEAQHSGEQREHAGSAGSAESGSAGGSAEACPVTENRVTSMIISSVEISRKERTSCLAA